MKNTAFHCILPYIYVVLYGLGWACIIIIMYGSVWSWKVPYWLALYFMVLYGLFLPCLCRKVIKFSTLKNYESCHWRESECLAKRYCQLLRLSFNILSHIYFFIYNPASSWISEPTDLLKLLIQPWRKSQICKRHSNFLTILHRFQ